MEHTITPVFDVVIIGGGPAGMTAALSAKKYHPEKTIAIIDKTFELGRKLCIAGAGRGNLTNIQLLQNPSRHYHGDKKLIDSVFSQCTYEDIIKFFENLGIPLYEEKKPQRGKIFPVINSAKTVRDILVDKIIESKISIYTNTEVLKLEKQNNDWNITTNNGNTHAQCVIVTAGGNTYPTLGSNGSLYPMLEKLGHTIVLPVPSAVPLVGKNPLSHFLQGEKMDMSVTVTIDKTVTMSTKGEVLFTQYGLSGTAIFDVSRDISVAINREKKQDVHIMLSFFPDMSKDEVLQLLDSRWKKNPTHLVSRSLWGIFSKKVSDGLCAAAGLPKEKKVIDMTDIEKQNFFTFLTEYSYVITGTRGWNEAEFTAGGVDTKDINPQTLESTCVDGLYIAGEILDIDGPVGGYNLSFAWASGFVAGKIQ